MRVLVLLAMVLASASASAQQMRVDQDVFATCSKRTNQLSNLSAKLQIMHTRAADYNKRHDLLRAQLDHREAAVHQIHSDLRGKPINRKNWDRYDDAFQLYEMAFERLREWNEMGEKLGVEYKLAINTVKMLQANITDDCKGTWEPAIINKFCDDDSGRHAAFCEAFEK